MDEPRVGMGEEAEEAILGDLVGLVNGMEFDQAAQVLRAHPELSSEAAVRALESYLGPEQQKGSTKIDTTGIRKFGMLVEHLLKSPR